MANLGAALGEAVGKLIERRITAEISRACAPMGLTVGPRKLTNGSGNTYQIDCVVEDSQGHPQIIIDPKYIRYTKHNRDKGSWLCVAHYNLRKTFPTIRQSITVLSGSWSAPSIAMIRSFGIEVHQIQFSVLVQSLARRGVTFDWHEKDAITPRLAWAAFQGLPDSEKDAIADEATATVLPSVVASVRTTLDADLTTVPNRVREVELLIKTTHDEFFLTSYSSVAEASQALFRLLTDRPDIRDVLR